MTDFGDTEMVDVIMDAPDDGRISTSVEIAWMALNVTAGSLLIRQEEAKVMLVNRRRELASDYQEFFFQVASRLVSGIVAEVIDGTATNAMLSNSGDEVIPQGGARSTKEQRDEVPGEGGESDLRPATKRISDLVQESEQRLAERGSFGRLEDFRDGETALLAILVCFAFGTEENPLIKGSRERLTPMIQNRCTGREK